MREPSVELTRKANPGWLSNGVGMVDTGGYGTAGTVASYVVTGEKSAALIDVGYSPNWSQTAEGLAALGVANEKVEYIFLTHVHLDHAGAAWEASRSFPNASFVVHEKGIRHLIDPSRLVSATRAGFGDQSSRVGDMKSVQPERIWPAKEERYELGRRWVEPIFTPGHMPGHMSLATDDGVVFTGDAVCVRREGLGLIPAGSPPIYDVKASVRSIERLEEMKPSVILAPHFGRYPETWKGLERHRETIQNWEEMISSKFDQGLDHSRVSADMRRFVLQEGATKESDLDEYSSGVLLDKLLGMTVEGYMGYLLAARQ